MRPIEFKFAGLHQNSNPTTKIEISRYVGSINFYSNFFKKLHMSLKPICDLLLDDVIFQWNPALQSFLQNDNIPLPRTFL